MRDALQNSSPWLDRKVTEDNTVLGAKVLALQGRHTQTHAHTCTHTDTHASMDTHTPVHTCIQRHTHQHTCTHRHVYMHAYVCAHTCAQAYAQRHLHTDTHTYVHTQTHTHAIKQQRVEVGRQVFPSPCKRGREARGMLRAPHALILGSARPPSAS